MGIRLGMRCGRTWADEGVDLLELMKESVGRKEGIVVMLLVECVLFGPDLF